MTIKEAMQEIERHRPALTVQEIQTLRGQVKSGETEAAMRGLAKILSRRRVHDGV